MAEEECGVEGEESSWTFYIEGFMCDDVNYGGGSDIDDSTTMTTPSLVSDAASSAVVKKKNRRATSHVEMGSLGFSNSPNVIKTTTAADHHHNHQHLIRSLCKQSSFKKQKTKVIPAPTMDFDLEDTASSPVNSPKVSSYMNDQFMMNQKGKGKIMEYVSEFERNSFGKGSGGGGGVFAVERDIAHSHAHAHVHAATNYPDFKKRTSTP